MLKQLRSKKLMKRILKGTLVLVIPSFVLFYGWSSLDQTQRTAATVYAKVLPPSKLPWPLNRWQPITRDEMHQASYSLLEKRKIEHQLVGMPYFPSGQPTDLFTSAEILREALNQRILGRFIKEAGFAVTNNQLRETIKMRFPRNTAVMFEMDRARKGQSEAQYLADMRREMLLAMALDCFLGQSQLSLFELWQEFSLQKETLQLDYVRIDASPFEEGVVIEQDNLEEHFKEYIERYRVPDRRRYRYISVSKDQIEQDTVITDDDARAFYEENKETVLLFRTPAKTQIRHILLKFPDPLKPTPSQEMLERMGEILAKVKAPEADFAALADKFNEDEAAGETPSEDPPARGGGMVGWIGGEVDRAKWGENFVDAAMELTEPNQTSGIIQSPKGLHILQAVDFRESEAQPYAQVVDHARTLASGRAVNDQLQAEIEQMREAAKGTTSLEGLADKLGLTPKETEFLDLTDGTIDPEVGSFRDSLAYINGLAIGELSGILTSSKGAVYLAIQEFRETNLPKLSDVRERVEADYRAWRGLELAREKAEEGLEHGKALEALEDWAESEGLQVKSTESFSRSSSPSELNETIDNLKALTYKTPLGAVRHSSLSLGGQPVGWIVWRIKDIAPPGRKEFIEEIPRLQRERLVLKQWTLFEEWLADARQEWGVKVVKREG
jgi:peptidyl-prolyl cis-trans isomerase D